MQAIADELLPPGVSLGAPAEAIISPGQTLYREGPRMAYHFPLTAGSYHCRFDLLFSYRTAVRRAYSFLTPCCETHTTPATARQSLCRVCSTPYPLSRSEAYFSFAEESPERAKRVKPQFQARLETWMGIAFDNPLRATLDASLYAEGLQALAQTSSAALARLIPDFTPR